VVVAAAVEEQEEEEEFQQAGCRLHGKFSSPSPLAPLSGVLLKHNQMMMMMVMVELSSLKIAVNK
jgi:hypothetical protein